jgi:hypothetical protein
MRKTLIVLAVLNVFASMAIIFGLSAAKGISWLWINDHAQRIEQGGAVDYDRLGPAVLGAEGPADRAVLEHAMGIDNLRYYGFAATALLLLTVVQTGAIVFCALRIPGDRAGSGPQPAALAGDVPER